MSKNQPNKKDQFIKPQKSKFPLIAGLLSLAIVAVIVVVIFSSSSQETGNYFGEPVASSRSYIGEFISMTTVEPEVEAGKVKISFDEVNQNNIVYFEVENNVNELVPLMAYITPSGRLFVGSSMCEPCRGRTFSLAGETMVCDTCRTTYNIEDHTFISGAAACGKLPPVNMNPVVEDDMIIINHEDVLNWRSRI